MPNLYLDALPSHISRSTVSRLLIQVGGIDKRLIGAIRVDGRRAAVEVPDKWSHRLAAALDGANLAGRHIRCWCETSFSEGDGESHFQRLCRLLSLEAEEEMRRAMAAASGDLAAAEQSGNTIGNLHIRERSGGLGGRLLITLSKDAPQLLPWTRLGVGAPILLTSQNDQRDGFRGVVSWKTQREIQVAFSQPPSDEQSAGPLRIDISPDEISHRRQRRALERAEQASGDRLSELRRALLGSRPPESVDGDAPQIAGNSLNQSQRRAIVSALQASDFAMIHGPPGTGKTTTVAHFINAAAARGETVLACAPSNLAVDNLFERVLALGDRAIRIGHPARVLPQLRDNTLDLMVQSHPDMQIVKKLTRDAHALLDRADRYTRSKPPPGAKREMRIEARQMLNDARRLESQVVHAILDEAQVICATLTSLDSDILGQRRFDWAVIDEACQSTEPACWIPLLRCDRLLLAGDHCQLPPTVISRDAQQQGFGVSLFERLMNAPGQQVSHVLQVQYRMHESIMEFSSSWFYDEQLTAAESVARHLLSELPDVEKNQWTE
ncbi:MAG: AAA domain-containing protein, partial [Pirellulaceae bacterium]|nr:AAA domain-containing protein [Pirellulaceae bacterium]